MSAPENEAHESPIKTPKQLVTVLVLAFVVPIVVIILLATLVTSGRRPEKDSPAMSAENIAMRLKPVAEIYVGNAPQLATAAAAPAASASAAGAKPDGKKVFESICTACHGTGVNGAPKFGDKAAWAPRLAHGVNALYTSALKGKGAMPPKGGNPGLSDADVKAAVDYMAGAAK
jgi:cytochrome c5